MWAMDNRKMIDHVWFMEDDVHHSNLNYLLEIMNIQDVDTDIAYQKDPGHLTKNGQWHYKNLTRQAMLSFFSEDQLDRHHQNVMLNFFYLSQRYLEKLVEVYQGMGQQWAFFESLFPTVTGVYDLRWTTFTPKKHFMHGSKPCHTNLTEKGVYHPVTYHDGKLFPCHCCVGYWKCAP
jgi:predicted nucleotidyltransferase